MALSTEQTGMDEVRDNLRRIEERISRLEAHLGLEA